MKKLLVGAVLLAIGAGGAWWAMRPVGMRAGDEVVYIVPLKEGDPRGYLPTSAGNVFPGTKLRLTEDVRTGVPLVRTLVLEGDAKGGEAVVDVTQIRKP